MEGRMLLRLFLVMFSVSAGHLVHGDDAIVRDRVSASVTKAYQESRSSSELKLVGRKLAVAVEIHGVAEKLTASRNTVTVAGELCGGGEGGGGRRSINCKRRLRRRISHEEWNNNDFVAFNADYKAPRHHPPKNN